jgi:hypothetical protein
MAHDVTFVVPSRPLGKNDVEFEVRKSGQKFGTLKVSKGALVWKPLHGKLSYKLSWAQFDNAMQEKGSKALQN